MFGQTRGGDPHKLGIENKKRKATSKTHSRHLAACNSIFAKVTESKLESGAQEIMSGKQ